MSKKEQHDINNKSSCVKNTAIHTQATFFPVEYELFGTNPDMASAFIRVMALTNAEALVGFARPARASPSISVNNFKKLLYLMKYLFFYSWTKPRFPAIFTDAKAKVGWCGVVD